MDFGSIIGLFAGCGLILTAILFGGDLGVFINLPGFMIVIGGSLAATAITFQLSDVKAAFRGVVKVFSTKKEDASDVISNMVELCKVSRKKGLLQLGKIEVQSKFLKKALALVADGAEEEIIKDALNNEISSLKKRHNAVQDVFKKMALYAPAFGMIGTLIGLVQMLQTLEDPSSVGPSMAVALITTLYGSIMASLIFGPIAGKLSSRTREEVLNMEIMFEGAAAILSDNNPIFVYEKLSSHIPHDSRKEFK